MAIKVGGTTVVDDSRGLANIQSISYSGDVNGVATYSVSFQGCKRYTIA